ncbi:hypothetical protein C3489_37990 [Streptomyces sp. Ru71]|nr:hypothetical protein C3489_37990 [Streptomyces sp. Ru71]
MLEPDPLLPANAGMVPTARIQRRGRRPAPRVHGKGPTHHRHEGHRPSAPRARGPGAAGSVSCGVASLHLLGKVPRRRPRLMRLGSAHHVDGLPESSNGLTAPGCRYQSPGGCFGRTLAVGVDQSVLS